MNRRFQYDLDWLFKQFALYPVLMFRGDRRRARLKACCSNPSMSHGQQYRVVHSRVTSHWCHRAHACHSLDRNPLCPNGLLSFTAVRESTQTIRSHCCHLVLHSTSSPPIPYPLAPLSRAIVPMQLEALLLIVRGVGRGYVILVGLRSECAKVSLWSWNWKLRPSLRRLRL